MTTSERSAVTADDLAARLERHVRTLAEVIGERNVYRPQALAKAADYIDDQWREIGYEVARQTYDVDSIACSNLACSRIGSRLPDEILLIGAHYDSVIGSPGANDNGSGVASLLELSREIADRSTDRTVRFVAFVNEEPPFFMTERMGSTVYANAAKARGDDITLMVSLETLGYYDDRKGSQRYPPLFRHFFPDQGNYIAFVSNLRSRRALNRFAAVFRQQTDFPMERVATFSWIPGVAWSDQYSFWRRGYRALMVTDTAFYRYPYYHTPADLAIHVDYRRLAELTDGLGRTVLRLAEAT